MSGKWKADAACYATIDAAVGELNAAGKSDQDIARELGISQGQASYRRAKLGLKSPYTEGTYDRSAKTDAGKVHEADIMRQRLEGAIPMGRGGDPMFASLLAGRYFQDDPRLRKATGPLPPPWPMPAVHASFSGSAAAWCASVGVRSRLAP